MIPPKVRCCHCTSCPAAKGVVEVFRLCPVVCDCRLERDRDVFGELDAAPLGELSGRAYCVAIGPSRDGYLRCHGSPPPLGSKRMLGPTANTAPLRVQRPAKSPASRLGDQVNGTNWVSSDGPELVRELKEAATAWERAVGTLRLGILAARTGERLRLMLDATASEKPQRTGSVRVVGPRGRPQRLIPVHNYATRTDWLASIEAMRQGECV